MCFRQLFGCFGSKEVKEKNLKSNKIDKEIPREKQRKKNEGKILLLGQFYTMFNNNNNNNSNNKIIIIN